MIHTINIFFSGTRVALSSRMAYRGDFVIRLFVMLIGDLLFPMITTLIYRSGASFPGWTLTEVLLVQGLFMLVKGLSFPFFFGMIQEILERVREGTFDLMLIKPCSVMYLSIVRSFNLEYFGSFFGGLALFIYALRNLGREIAPLSWLYFFILSGFAILLLLSFTLIMSGTLFKWVGNSRIYEMFEAVSKFCLYPKSIYSQAFQNIISYIIPIAMIAFFPAAALLERLNPAVIISAAVCLVFFLLSRIFWHVMLKQYTSAGG
ncbi:MAG: ABC transporter permease [Halanaerobiales bacterium]